MSDVEQKPHIRVNRCSLCNDGIVVPWAGDGRFFQHPDYGYVHINLPATIFILKCMSCRHNFANTTEMRALIDAALMEELRPHKGMIAKCIDRLRAKVGEN